MDLSELRLSYLLLYNFFGDFKKLVEKKNINCNKLKSIAIDVL